MNTSGRYLKAQEAADLLEISLPTLYSYVSRGLIRSELVDVSGRARRYYAEDVEALRERKEYRRNPGKAAQSALSYGMPVLDSAITLIQDGRFYYRGYDVLALARQRTVEEVAALIWLDRFDTGELFTARRQWVEQAASGAGYSAGPLPSDQPISLRQPIELFQAMLLQAGMDDLAAYNPTSAAVAANGAGILQMLCVVASGHPPTLPLARALQAGWAPNTDGADRLLSAAMILCADHELNVSAFTARCVASAGSTPYAVVIAGLSALQGHRHGGHTARVAALLTAAQGSAKDTVAAYLRRGDPLPGFGHPLYPNGDPRGRLLLDMVEDRCPQSEVVALARTLCTAAYDALGLHPTIDLALEVASRALGLPANAALALFALGRTIGWIGHAIEQYASGQLIRPRARYTGVQARVSPTGAQNERP